MLSKIIEKHVITCDTYLKLVRIRSVLFVLTLVLEGGFS
jgi:hypothetical protein